MKFPQINLFIVVGLCLALTFACNDDSDDDMTGGGMEDCATLAVSYSGDIVPILNQTCAIPNCHADGFPNGDYELFPDFKAAADSGSLQNQIESGAMPRFDTTGPTELTDEELNLFLCWIGDGALEN